MADVQIWYLFVLSFACGSASKKNLPQITFAILLYLWLSLQAYINYIFRADPFWRMSHRCYSIIILVQRQQVLVTFMIFFVVQAHILHKTNYVVSTLILLFIISINKEQSLIFIFLCSCVEKLCVMINERWRRFKIEYPVNSKWISTDLRLSSKIKLCAYKTNLTPKWLVSMNPQCFWRIHNKNSQGIFLEMMSTQPILSHSADGTHCL